ncbi:hypothetical protein AB0A69_01060 [Streptomyces sp. NPDC045431]|uniref:hypothetical protein n=1 Tax=Streptomyces sp. NPDC045431 TaxID=3155613 RepID=UPI0033CB9324
MAETGDTAETGEGARPDGSRAGTGLALWMPIGVALGISLGQLSDNLGLGIALGLGLGTAVGTGVDASRRKQGSADHS